MSKQPTLFEYSQCDSNITCIVTGEQWKQNTYIINQTSSSNTIIVDPGSNADLIIKYIQDRCWKVTRILLTHPHHDHVGAASQVSERFNLACELHNLDVRLLMHAPMYALRFANKIILSVPNFEPFDELCISKEEPIVRSLHTPGHTKGSVCYLFNGFVLTGDTLLYKHIGRTDLPGSSEQEISESIIKLLTQLSDKTIIFPGHGKPWIIGEAKAWWRETHMTLPIHNKIGQL